tara:strand:- start:1258 stop:1497 length:240 start_codon:yes stop_codon:yes gene_type:complete
MESLPLGEVIGIGGVAVGFGYLLWKIWNSQTEMTSRVIDVVEKSAKANMELKNSIDENTRETREQRDVLSRLLLESVKK